MKINIIFLAICLILLSACNVPSTLPPTNTVVFFPTSEMTNTQTQLQPSPTLTPNQLQPSQTFTPVVTASLSASSSIVYPIDVGANIYIDNRSDAINLIASYYNAINRHEYIRAYSYWQSDNTSLDAFQVGYATTQSVQILIGSVTGDAGAGNFYNTIQIGLIALTSDGKTQQFVACYELHLANPGIQGTLPFQSLGIVKGIARKIDGTDLADQVENACTGTDIPSGQIEPTVQPPTNLTDVSPHYYIDDRSDPVQVLRSFYNAINRSEYLRAYSYWESNAAGSNLPSMDVFSQGYADTEFVQLTTGIVVSDAGAGQYHYRVPVTLIAKTKSGTTQSFVGCYVLHLSNPGMQGTLPFEPLGISSANAKQVDNNADTANLMTSACTQ